MKNPESKPRATIAILYSDLEGAAEIVHGLKKAGYETIEIAEVKGAEIATLRDCELLIVALPHWPAMRRLLKSDEKPKSEIEPGLAMIVGCPADAGLRAVLPEEPDENTAVLPCPLDAGLLLFQVEALLSRRRVEGDLRYRLKEREDVLQSISEVFFSVDHNFCYTFFNEKAERVGGKPARELIGKNMWETFPFLKNTEFDRQIHQVAADRQILISEYLGPITGGWFEMRIYPSAGGISALFVDISARKKAEEGLQQAQEQLTAANGNLERAVEERTAQLHEANERLEELLYSIAHDLRSPLRSMQGFAQAFVEDFAAALDGRAKGYAQKMTVAAVLMDRMLGDLIELSRVTKADLQLDSVSVAEAWKSVRAQHEEKIRSLEARLDVAPNLGQVTANRTLLTQILANLLGNALKFSRPGVRPEIRFWTEPLDSRFLAIYVEDNGIGIDGRYQEKVFRVFERLNGSEYEGTGIGLAIARKAAERMKGQLDFTSNLGVGTTFRLKLPGNQGDAVVVPKYDSDG